VTVHTFRRAYTNAHLVRRGDVAFLVDSGLEGEAPALEAELRAIGVDPATLKAVVLTHGHAAHEGGRAQQHHLRTRRVARHRHHPRRELHQ
jgi:glyoxylase-like metal-dependent hydrolase (beta-lactamase superfamily II)